MLVGVLDFCPLLTKHGEGFQLKYSIGTFLFDHTLRGKRLNNGLLLNPPTPSSPCVTVLDRWSALRICFASNSTEGQDVSTNARVRKCLREASCQPKRDVQVQPQESVREKKGLISDKRTCYPADPLGPTPGLHCACGEYCWTKESILCISGATAEVSGPRCGPWWLCCSSAVIWSVSCGILIESEAFQINPETSGLPARASWRGRVTAWSRLFTEPWNVPSTTWFPFLSLLGRLPVLQARLTVSQTQTGPQATSGCNSSFIPPSNTSAWGKRENLI